MRLIQATHACNLASAAMSVVAVSAMLFAVAPPASAAAEAASAPVDAAPRPASLWSAASLQALKAETAAAELEGLDPAAYNIGALEGLSEGPEADRVATSIALSIAEDYARGRIADTARFGWHIERNSADANRLTQDIHAAVREGRLQPWLRTLLPTDERYVALRTAHASATDGATRAKLRANMERWRWLPRSLGKDHIYVNVPSYTLSVVDEGRPVSTYTVVVGKPSTPTPQIAVPAQSVVVNPWWNVPRSIARTLKASAGKGYVVSRGAIRQRPGPGNALGKVKIDMPNPHSIYLHDTPSKSLFAEKSRAFSHGCIRVKDIDKLAKELMELDSGETAEVERALAGSATRTVRLQQVRPVYLVYFTMDLGADGRVVTLEDPYGRDTKLIASLERETQLAAAQHRAPAKKA